jgi:SAM-dependent methyltransferase
VSSPVPCTVCARPASPWGTKRGYRFYRCQGCSHLFVWPMPADSLRIYDEQYFSGAAGGFGYVDYDRDKQAMAPVFHLYLDKLGLARPDKGALLDIGAATGFFLDIARQRGWRTGGIEPGAHAAAQARAKGLDVQTGTLQNCSFPPGSFDVITLWDVLEHLTDPRLSIQQASGLLKPGGVIAINTPDSGSLFARLLGTKWHLLDPPEHLNLFHRRSVRLLLEQCGFEILETTAIGKKFTLQYVLRTLGHWQGGAIWDSAARRLRNTPFRETALSINLYDNFFLLARKP